MARSQPRAATSVALIVLDGFGLSDDPARNVLLAADLPTWRSLTATWPTCRLAAAGEAVGLPPGQMGNSEVGHLNLGAGMPVLQDLPRISAAVADGSFFANAALNAAAGHVLRTGGRLHLMGLIGPGGVHAVDEHIVAMVELAHRSGLSPDRVLLHAFTDGRDTPPRSADAFMAALEERIAGKATVATVSGRFYAMDRDRRWERTQQAYEAIARGRGRHATTAVDAIALAYAREESDEFIDPTVIAEAGARGLGDGDAVVHLNFRADRARQLIQSIALPEIAGFDRGRSSENVSVTTLTEYQARDELPVSVAFPPIEVDSLAAHLSRLGLQQLHVAETEKYAHVTYFFNGGIEEPFRGEDRVLVPSTRAVPTYDLAPEMMAPAITDRVVAAIEAGEHAFIVANYANADMVGHTGVWDAAVRAAEVIDACLERLSRAALAAGVDLVVTADHGNIEEMRDADGHPQTQHTMSPVPLVLVGERWRGTQLRDGSLADVAPTICQLMGIPPGPHMTGRSLLEPATASV